MDLTIPLYMKRNKFTFLLIGLLLAAISGFRPAWIKKQGIEGYLHNVSGNQMPSPDIKPSPPKGVKGSIYVYQLTNINQAVKKPGSSFYSSVSTRLVKRVESNSKGYFSVTLPVGKYSLFIKKDTVLYANRFDSQNNIAPVEVKAGKMTKVDVRMDHNAVY
jgi:hypothetical protein